MTSKTKLEIKHIACQKLEYVHDPIATGQAMKELRKQFGYTQQVVATCMNIPVASLSRLEKGKRNQTPETMQRFIDALNRLNKVS